MTITQALISVSDKSGVLEFAKGLHNLGVKILSTGGTAKLLTDNGVPCTEVADYTGFPEMLDGRVKTLQPKVHAGILARRDLPEHVATLKKHDIPTIDLVVVNLYPFAATIAKPGCTLEDAIENIDIGGPSMIRSAAKNYKHVAVIVDPDQYAPVLEEMKNKGIRLIATSQNIDTETSQGKFFFTILALISNAIEIFISLVFISKLGYLTLPYITEYTPYLEAPTNIFFAGLFIVLVNIFWFYAYHFMR